MLLLGLSLLTFLASLVLCRLLIVIAPKDAPDNGRKTQAFAVPTSGGLAIAASIIVPWLIFLSLSPYEQKAPLNTFSTPAFRIFTENGGVLLILIWIVALGIGAFDDSFGLRAKLKFAVLAMIALLVSGFGKHIEGIFLPSVDSYVIIAAWIGIGGSALWIFVMMNATNFMDGSNGLAIGTLAVMLAGICLHPYYDPLNPFKQPSEWYNQHLLSAFSALTISAVLGFLFWNLQGKLYAGDAGSLFGGAVFASLGIYAAQDGNIWFPATLALPFLVDVFMTLLWRARQGHNLLTPHRHHAYQLLIKSGWSHLKTALLWWSFAALCAVVALWAASDSKSMSAYVFLGLLGAGCLLWGVQRRRAPRAIL